MVLFLKKINNGKNKKPDKLLTSHRSTIYPCSLPRLGDSTGAGRIRPVWFAKVVNYKLVRVFCFEIFSLIMKDEYEVLVDAIN